MKNFSEIERKESEPKLLFKVILMRHEETEYTNVGHDLTDRGVEGAKETGRMLKDDDFFTDTDEELGGDPARIAESHYTHDIHKNHPEIIEPHLKKKERLYRAMEYLIRSV